MLTLLHLLSSIALLVWGTHIVRTGIMRVYGSHLRRLLSHSMAHTPLAFGAGIGVTALVQSSNATALLTFSFVAQGLMALPTALAIMLGADVGTALMARVLTLDLSWLSPVLTLVGVSLFLSRKQSRVGQLGRVMIGLGLIILALQLIVAAAEPITEARGMQVLFAELAGDTLLAVVVGALFALLSYSSLAAVLLTATLAGAGLIGMPVALGVVIGANVGSGVLAWLNASLQPPQARRVALGNLLYKLAGLAVVPFLDPLVGWMATLGFSLQTQVIAFHLFYNTLRCLVLLPTVRPMAHLCEQLLPDRRIEQGIAQPRHLDPAALETPSLALANAVRETLRIGDLVESMLARLLEVLQSEHPQAAEEIRRLDDDVDALYSGVKLYLARMPREDLADQESRRWAEIIELAINLEHAGDIIEHMLGKVQTLKKTRRMSFSESGLEELGQLHALLSANLSLGLSVFLSGDPHSARRLLRQKRDFRQRERELAHAHVHRLHQQVLESIETSAAHLELIADMKRLNSLFCSPAYAALEGKAATRERLPSEPAATLLPAERHLPGRPV
ncbi:Na/Pi cotransporter family protein [Stutzerimonas balearica]|jgi:phosphate:Na+ symporter|uniref:Na/Pi cotransporter family protein n=1 Tax=Stutzerimonas balearica TaxID=74829 RepID=A0A9X7UYA7_9GAMM|nr:Na/Pi cotransporter family protein [Stutzerimonas balearica]KIL03610.1 membrane protein [Stutzerimonas stutzeri]MBZ5754628.1 Na/Pi cotransporter family protein [Pseudomonas sp. S5(2021)]MBD3735425.1 Na/Pi cotransporter family protein [Stutzerimonas balearica]MBK3746591.1 Na/Pi cotransporter family protein [Stutzerimonas balearica]MBK3824788.1 Na/Pi cotransporter family protein [Stutzerimonas balearica]